MTVATLWRVQVDSGYSTTSAGAASLMDAELLEQAAPQRKVRLLKRCCRPHLLHSHVCLLFQVFYPNL